MAADQSDVIVNTESEENGNEMSYSEEFTVGGSGIKLYQWQYEPKTNTPRGLLFLAHGYGEHSKRFDVLARKLCSELECVAISHDHVGHGKSEGERVMVDRSDVFVEDVFHHIEQVKKSYPQLPVYLFGHSMGGTISILAACKRPDYFTAVILCAPAILLHPDIAPGCFKTFFGKIMSRICPSMEILPALDPSQVTSDELQAQIYKDDPLVWHGGIKCKMAKVLGEDLLHIQEELIPTIEWPFLIVHGDHDKISYIGGAEMLMKNSQSKDKHMKVYKGLRHDILHEVKEQTDQVMTDIVEWFRARIVS